jgi:histidinol dehydrogenase
MIRIIPSSDTAAVERLVTRRADRGPSIDQRAQAIVDAVRRQGDVALIAYARRFDMLQGPVELSRDDIVAGARQAPAAVRSAIALAARHIRRVAARQRPSGWTLAVAPGVTVEQRVVPLDTVGCYVPGGRHPLPSSLLMTALPARVAGVREIVVACPNPGPAVLCAAVEAGVTRLFRMGGAHAIAALAYGTPSVPRVDKIVGPGNAWVAAAKALVSRDCAIDFNAGPSEIVVVSSDGDAELIALDLVAQAEHDPDARAILITPSKRLAARVARRVAALASAPGPAQQSLAGNGAVVLTRTLQEAIALVNQIAPEHAVCDDDAVAAAIVRAGAVFVGRHSAQAAGDYVTGSNHVLPTGGAARARGGLSAADFVRVISVQRLTARGIARVGPAAVTLAQAEGLEAHAASIAARLHSRTAQRRT